MSRAPLLALGLLISAPPDGSAIPAFARRYGLPCSSCHDPFPKLNGFGERFMTNGYALAPGDTTGTTSNGDPLLVLNQVFPLAVRFDAYARYTGGRGGRADLQTPYVVKLLSGGPIARNISYYIYLMLAEDGRTGSLEDANVTFTEVAGAPITVTVGQFQIIDPVWKRELRISLEDYAILKHRPGFSSASLTYDRGILAAWSPTSRLTITGEVVNGNGIDEAVGGRFDGDGPKTAVVAATQAFGPARVTLLAYEGRQDLIPTGDTSAVRNRTRMIGPALQASLGSFDLGAQLLYREDSNPSFGPVASGEIVRGGFAELSWWPRGRGNRLLVTGLYNAVEAPGRPFDYETATLNLSWLHARNVRMAAEATWNLVSERPSFALGFATAF